ncbi:MAG TPA: FAD-dependent oxidoreductase [Pseudomonadales bacterium]|nr:FAD-dependent oxidoreductase [Pseudomonadales bacterium]
MITRNRVAVDVAVVGGGIAGLWIAERVRAAGYRTLLLERSAFGDGQTIRSQGMIHGGLKYALNGAFGAASRALIDMPARWRASLAGTGTPDLRGVRILSERGYLWSPNESALGRLGTLVASKFLSGRVRSLARGERPAPFDDPRFGGAVYELDELVLDTASLLARLAERVDVVRADVVPQSLVRDAHGALVGLRLDDVVIDAGTFVFAAGAGNAAFLSALGARDVAMQRRPLHQTIVRHRQLPPLFGHCMPALGEAEPRLTITTHATNTGETVWYLGGRLANDGVARDAAEQIRCARAELAACVPWIDTAAARFETVRIDRAEPYRADGARPDTAFVAAVGNAVICWPTKLALAPDLGDRAIAALTVRQSGASHTRFPSPAVTIATAPWDH